MPLRQSFSWWCFTGRGRSPAELFSGAKTIGFDAVELVGEELWPVARDEGLAISSIRGHESISQGANRRENAVRIRQELRQNLEKAAAWNIPLLVCFSGERGGMDDEAGLDTCAETLADVLPAAERAGVVLAMELLNSKVDHADYQCDRTAWGVELCRRLGSPSFKLLYDIYHMQIMEGDVVRTIRGSHGFFAHYHTAGCPGRGPMDEDQELNYGAIYRAVAETGYKGFIGHEFLPREDPLKELAKAFRQCADAVP